MFSQALTLGLNLRLDTELHDLIITEQTFWTYASSGCCEHTEDNYLIPDTEEEYTIPASIWNYFGEEMNVGDLFDLANMALGGEVTDVPLGDITEALGVINDGFDECRFLFYDLIPITMDGEIMTDDIVKTIELSAIEMDLNIFPNPFRNETSITFSVVQDTRTTVEVYTIQSAKVATLFDGPAKPGESYSATFTAQSNVRSQVYLVVFQTEYGRTVQRFMSY